MPRRIQTTAYQSTEGGTPDTYFDRVVKYVPADVVAAWTAVAAAVKGAGASVSASTVLWICLIFGLIITPFWVLKQTDAYGKPKAYQPSPSSCGCSRSASHFLLCHFTTDCTARWPLSASP